MSLGFEILYPTSCQEVSEDLSLNDLRKRLTDLSDALQKESLEQSNLDDSALETPIDDHPFKRYRGLLMHLNSSQFSEHFDTSVRIRACVCAMHIVKLLCPSNPFESLVEEALLKKGFLDWILDSINHLSSIKSTSEPLFPKSLFILRTAAQLGIFIWITESQEASKMLTKMVKTFYSVLKTVEIWTWSDRSSVINLLVSCIGLVIKRAEHLLTDETLIFIVKHLIDPYKSAHPVLTEASRDFLLSYSTLVQEHIQLLIQKSLVSSQFFKLQTPKTEIPSESHENNLDLDKEKEKPAFDVDMDADEKDGKSLAMSDEAELNGEEEEDDDEKEKETLEKQIGDRIYLLIRALHSVQHNLVAPILPSLTLKLTSTDIKERKRSFRLLTCIYSEKDSDLPEREPKLWQAYLGRFQDINVEMRRICIHSFALIAESNPKLAMDQLLEVFLKRVFDLVEEIRVLALQISKKLLSTIFKEGEIHDRIFELFLGRVRDKSFQVRREVLGILGAVYKQYLKLWVKVPAAELGDAIIRKMEGSMQRIMNTILYLYYLPSVDDRIIIERFLKGCVFPHSMSCQERSRALLLAYRIADNSSIKVVEEIFNVHHDSYLIMKSMVSMLSSTDPAKLHTSCAITRAIGHKLDACASLLPQSPKYGDLIKRYFLGSQLLPTVKQHLLKLFTKPITCSEAVSIVLKLYNSEVPGTLSQKESIKHAVKLLLERTAPVIFDSALCAEILNQMVIELEIISTKTQDSHFLVMERYIRLLHSLSACYIDVLPSEDVIDFLQSLLEQTTSEAAQLSPQDRLSLQTIEASALNVFCVILGYKKTPAHGAPVKSKAHEQRSGQEIEETASRGDRERDFTCPFDINSSVQLSPKLMNLFPFFKRFTVTPFPAKECVADSWNLERKRSKYSVRALSLIIYSIDGQLDVVNEIKIPEPLVEFSKKEILVKSLQKEVSSLEKKYDSSKQEFLHIFKDRCERLLDSIVNDCLHIDKKRPDSVAKLAALSQISLRFPGRYSTRISDLFLRLLNDGIFSESSGQMDENASPKARKDLSLLTKIKLGILKLMTNWLCGLNTDNEDYISSVLSVIFKLVQMNGDLVEDSKLEPAELARIRAAAGCAWLKLARYNHYSKFAPTAWFYRIGELITDPCTQVSNLFASKLNQGVLNLRLPPSHLALFANVDPDSELAKKVKTYLQTNVERRRNFLARKPQIKEDAASYFAILPENVMIFVIHQLAHSSKWTELYDHDSLLLVKSQLWFMLESLMNKGLNYCYFRKMLENIKHMEDACCSDPEINEKLYLCCDICCGLLITRSSMPKLTDHPFVARVPKYLFKSAPKKFQNPEYKQLLVCAEEAFTIDPATDEHIPVITFAPPRSKHAELDEIPTILLHKHQLKRKKNASSKKPTKNNQEESEEEPEEEKEEQKAEEIVPVRRSARSKANGSSAKRIRVDSNEEEETEESDDSHEDAKPVTRKKNALPSPDKTPVRSSTPVKRSQNNVQPTLRVRLIALPGP